KSGEMWGIIGPNGSGKTTLLYSLANLLPVLSGDIFLQEKKISRLSQKNIARQLGILFQDSSDIFPQSVFEFCSSGRYPHLNYFSFGKKEDAFLIKKALSIVDLEKNISQKVHTLSGGERRRLDIATLLSQSPTIYLLDEPTNHLDIRYQIKILDHFKQLTKREPVSVVMSIHDINLAAHYCDKILMLLGEGEYLEGDPSNLFSEKNLERLYQHRFQKITVDAKSVWTPV
ncbi:MAG TPA: ABC transporter ATP-binding protein, partial [Gammaproteobacteria bacterium]|nr:ABC transporter ATP-binding protein [Gammaproteobacteria bacterium]